MNHLWRQIYHDDGGWVATVCRQALEIRLRVYGDDDTRVASVLHLLGDMALNADRRDEAEAFYQRALTIRRERLDEDHTALAQARLGLAEVLVAEVAGVLLARALATLYRVKPAGDWGGGRRRGHPRGALHEARPLPGGGDMPYRELRRPALDAGRGE